MSDVNANIGVHIDTSQALAELKSLQRQLALFHSSVAKGSASAAAQQRNMQQNLLNSINATGKFSAQMGVVRTSTESFTNALEKNKLSMREYFRYAGGSTKTFGRLFKAEFDTIGKVAEDRVRRLQTQYIKLGRDTSGAMKAISVTPNTLNMKDYGNQVAVAAQKQALLNQLLKQGSTNLLNFGKNTQWAGRQLMVGFTIPLAYLGTAAAKTFMDLEAQAIRFKRVYGEMFTTTDETNKALDNVRKLAESFTKYGVAVVDTMKMAADAAAMGKTGAELTAQISEATRLSVLGNVEQGKALETTISVTNAFGIAAEDLASKINFLNAVENQTVLSIEDLTEAIPKAGPVVKQLGGSVEDLAFFMTAMKEGGINASEGANALKSGLASLINPSKKASDMLAGFGINIKGIVEANKGDLKATVVGFAQALDTLDPLNRARAIEQLFGKFQFSRLSTLFQNVTKDGTQANRVLGLTQASVAELAILSERELKTVENAVGVKFKSAVQDLKLALEPVGKSFLEAVTPIAQSIGRLLDKFNNLGEGTKKFIVVATTLVGVIGPVLLMSFGLLLNAGANMIKLFTTLRGGFLKLSGNSNILAEQTNYLTAEQLEAATVASSLNQTHSKLTQQFVMEADAVMVLRQAYLEASAAAARFAAINPGMMVPGFKPGIKGGGTGKKFAGGTTGVVGGINGKDSVPALLMPGEAVVPTKTAQDDRFKPLVEALVTGKIAKYGTGTKDAGSITSTSQSTKTSFGHIVPFREARASQMSVLGQQFGFKRENIYTALGFDINPNTNTRMNQATVSLGQYRAEINRPEALKTMTAKLIEAGLPPKKAYNVAATVRANLLESLKILPDNHQINDRTIYSRMGNNKTGIIGGLLKNKNSVLRNAVQTLYAESSRSMGGTLNLDRVLKNVKKIGTFPSAVSGTSSIQNVVSAARSGKLNQSSLNQLLELEKVNPNLELNVIRDKANGRIVGFERPEIDNGRISLTKKNIALMVDDKFRPVRALGSSSRQIEIAKTAKGKAEEFIRNRTAKLDKYGIAERFAAARKGEYKRQSNGELTRLTGQNTASKPANIQTTSRNVSDNRVTPLNPNETIVQRIKRLRGFANAPQVDPKTGLPLSQIQSRMALGPRGLQSKKDSEKAIRDNTKEVNKDTKVTTETAATKKSFAQSANTAVGAISALTIAASFTGGKMGEVAQKILPLIFVLQGLTMLASNLSKTALTLTPMKAGLITVTAVLASFYFATKSIRDTFNKANKEALDLGTKISSTKSALDGLAKFANKVSAQELADYERNKRFSPFSVQSGKTTFGSAFIQGEQGKATVAALAKVITDKGLGGRQGAQQELFAQLSTGISTGLFSVEQARSLAVNIAEQLGDLPLGLTVAGQLDSLMGPDGSNLLNNPLKIRVQLIEEATKSVGTTALNAQEAGGFKVSNLGLGAMNKNVSIGGMIAATSGIGAAAGTVVPGIGNVVGAVAGAIAGGFIAVKAIAGQAAAVGKLTGAAVASQQSALNQQNELRASLEQYYAQEIKQAEAEGNIVKLKELQNDLIRDRISLDNKALKTNEAIVKAYDSSKGNTQAGLLNAAKESVIAQYKGTGQEQFAGAAQELLKGVSGRNEYVLTVNMGAGNIAPSDMVNLINIIGKDKKSMDAVINVMTKFGGKTGGQISQVIGAFVDKEGNQNTKVSADFIAKVNLQKTGEEAQQFIDFYAALGQSAGVVDVAVIADYYLNDKNKGAKDSLQAVFDAIKKNEGKLSIEVATTFLSPEAMGAINVDYFNKLNQAQKAVYLQEVATVINMDEASVKGSDDFKKWQKEAGPLGGSQYSNLSIPAQIKKYADALGQTVTNARVDLTIAPPTPNVDNGAGKQRDTILDDLLLKLKLFRKESVNALGGWEELLKQLGKGRSIPGFDGVVNKLEKLKANEFTLEMARGLDAENAAKFFDKITDKAKNGKLVLGKYGEALQKLGPAAQVGVLRDNQSAIRAQQDNELKALTRLKTAGIDSATALKMTANSLDAAAIASGEVTDEQIKNLAISAKMATDATKKLEQGLKRIVDFQASEEAEGAAEQLSEEFDYAFLEIERKARETFLSINKMTPDQVELSIAIDERAIEKIQNQINGINSEIKSYNRTLDLIGRQETAITETYDQKIDYLNKQKDALESVKSINSFLISQQQKQLGLANALTQGDISAAAAAAQDMRAEAAQEALNRMGTGLEKAVTNLEVQKQKELSSIVAIVNGQKMTRKQIEAEVVTLNDQIYNIEVSQLEPLQKQAEAKRQLLSDLAFQIEQEQKSLQINGITKNQWNFIQQYVEASNKKLNDFKTNIDAIALSSTTAANAWKSIADSIKTASSFNASVTGSKLNTNYAEVDGINSTYIDPKTGHEMLDLADPDNAASARYTAQAKALGYLMYGGKVKYMANGGLSVGSDTVPTMLTPGEFVVNKAAAQQFGPLLQSMNESKYPSMLSALGGSTGIPVNNVSTSLSDNSTAVYNYNLGFSINGANSNPNDIARAVMREIKNVDSQRIRGQRV